MQLIKSLTICSLLLTPMTTGIALIYCELLMTNQSGFRTNRPWQLFTRWQSPELFNRQHFPYIKSKFSQ